MEKDGSFEMETPWMEVEERLGWRKMGALGRGRHGWSLEKKREVGDEEERDLKIGNLEVFIWI